MLKRERLYPEQTVDHNGYCVAEEFDLEGSTEDVSVNEEIDLKFDEAQLSCSYLQNNALCAGGGLSDMPENCPSTSALHKDSSTVNTWEGEDNLAEEIIKQEHSYSSPSPCFVHVGEQGIINCFFIFNSAELFKSNCIRPSVCPAAVKASTF